MNYAKLILDTIEKSMDPDVRDAYNDYRTLCNMKKNYAIDFNLLQKLHKKYEDEINYINQCRIIVNSYVGRTTENIKPTDDRFVDIMIDMLFRICLLRSAKNEVNDSIKQQLSSENDKQLYDTFKKVIDGIKKRKNTM